MLIEQAGTAVLAVVGDASAQATGKRVVQYREQTVNPSDILAYEEDI